MEIAEIKKSLKTNRKALHTARKNYEAACKYEREVKKSGDEAKIAEAASEVRKADATVSRFEGRVKTDKQRLHDARVQQQPQFVQTAIANKTFRKVIGWSLVVLTGAGLVAGGIYAYDRFKDDENSEAEATTDEV
jgi:hypothetical protein